jgi:aminoglycoside 3-N-acetyltransferase
MNAYLKVSEPSKSYKNTPLYEYDNKKIFYIDIEEALKKLIKPGDIVWAHSDISVLGKLCLFDRKQLLDSFLLSLKECVDKNGTIIMPTFTYSFCKNEIFDIENTKSTVGILSEYFRNQTGVLRSNHPIFSSAVYGKYKNEFTNIGNDSFGEDSIFAKLHKLNGKIVFLGAPFLSCTYLHYIEQKLNVPYRYLKKFTGTIKTNNKPQKNTCTFFVRKLDKNVELDTTKLEKHLLENKMMKKVNIGNGIILSVKANDLFMEVKNLLKKDINFLLKEPWNLKK